MTVSKKKKKFDLTALVHDGYIKEGETLYFVSDPSKTCTANKQPNHEYKVKTQDERIVTVHAFAQECLGTEPPDHAAKWLRTQNGKTLYEYWQADAEDQAA